MDPNDALKGRTRETKIRRDEKGVWYEDGLPLDHENLTRSFDGWIDRAEDGRFCLSNDINWAYVEIEGPPYFVRSAHIEGDAVEIHLSGDRRERLDPSSLRQDRQGALYCDVREGRCPARFDNHAVVQLGDRVGEDEEGVFMELGGRRIRPPVVDDPLAGP